MQDRRSRHFWEQTRSDLEKLAHELAEAEERRRTGQGREKEQCAEEILSKIIDVFMKSDEPLGLGKVRGEAGSVEPWLVGYVVREVVILDGGAKAVGFFPLAILPCALYMWRMDYTSFTRPIISPIPILDFAERGFVM